MYVTLLHTTVNGQLNKLDRVTDMYRTRVDSTGEA